MSGLPTYNGKTPSQKDTSLKYNRTTIIHGSLPDLVLKSSDSILFYVHSELLNRVSTNHFGGLAFPGNNTSGTGNGSSSSRNPIVPVPDDSPVLTIILDIIYHTPSSSHDFAPPFPYSRFATALRRLHQVYQVDLQAQLDLVNIGGPGGTGNTMDVHPMLQTLHAHAAATPRHALELYILAAQFNMDALAVAVSAYLVGFPIAHLTDQDAEAMGPRYLRRLMLMQMRREEALKRILLQPPYPHPPTPNCDVLDQKVLTRAWILSAAYFVWDIRADLPPSALENLLGPLAGHISCEFCKRSIREQVTKIVREWKAVKSTI